MTRVHRGLTMLDTIQGTVGAISLIPDALTSHEEAVYTTSLSWSQCTQRATHRFLNPVFNRRDRRGFPLVRREPLPAEEGRDHSWATTAVMTH